VWLRGTTPEGDELELEIAVQRVPVPGQTIHQLAARKILQELKDGTSYVHGAVDSERQPGLLQEGVRVGLKYEVASHRTSFVAVERNKESEEEERRDQGVVGESPPSGLDEEDWDNVIEARDDSDDEDYSLSLDGLPAAPSPYESPQPVSRYPGSSSAASAFPSPDPPSGPFAGTASGDIIKGLGSLLANKTGMMPAPDPVSSTPRRFYTGCSKGKHPLLLGYIYYN